MNSLAPSRLNNQRFLFDGAAIELGLIPVSGQETWKALISSSTNSRASVVLNTNIVISEVNSQTTSRALINASTIVYPVIRTVTQSSSLVTFDSQASLAIRSSTDTITEVAIQTKVQLFIRSDTTTRLATSIIIAPLISLKSTTDSKANVNISSMIFITCRSRTNTRSRVPIRVDMLGVLGDITVYRPVASPGGSIEYQKLAILKDVGDVHVEYELNTWPTLRFFLPPASIQWEYIQNEFYVEYRDELYIIKIEESKRNNDGSMISTIECPSIACELNSKLVQVLGSTVGPPGHSPELFHESGTPAYIMGLILAGTGWSIGTISPSLQTKVRSFLSEWESVAANLGEVAEKFEGYLRYRPKERLVDLLDDEDIGENNKVTIEYAKNMTEITRTSDTNEFVTKLYVYGGVPPYLGSTDQLEMTINYVGVGVEDPNDPYYRPPLERVYEGDDWVACTSYIYNFQYFEALGYDLNDIVADVAANGRASKFVKEGQFKDEDFIDPYKLYDHAKKKLDRELSLPVFNYSVGLIDLSRLSGWYHESFKIGDWVTIIDRELNIEVEAQIVKMTEYPGFPEKTTIELSNSRDTIGDVLANTIKVAGGLQRKSSIHQLKRNMLKTVSMLINTGYSTITLQDEENPNRLVRLSSGGIGVSKDGGQTFPYAMTGEGMLGDLLVVSDLHAVSVEDSRTRLQSSGLTVFDNNEIKRVHVGQFEPGNFGIQVHSGSIKITGGGLPDSEIGSISAGKIIGGTITAEQAIYLGDDHFELNALGRHLIIRDHYYGQSQEVVRLGRLGNNYGLFIYGPDGNIKVAADKTGIDIFVEEGLRIMGENLIIDKHGLELLNKKMSTILDGWGINPDTLQWFPNKCFNSGFDRYNPNTLKPYYWEGAGVSSKDAAFEGTVSLKLTPGQVMKQGMFDQNTHAGADPAWWASTQTRVGFRHKRGAVRVWIERVSNGSSYFLTDNSNEDNIITGYSLYYPFSENWSGRNTFYFIPSPGDGKVRICFQCVDPTEATYIDVVQIGPDRGGKWLGLYDQGPYSSPLEAEGGGGTNINIDEFVEYTDPPLNWNRTSLIFSFRQQYSLEPILVGVYVQGSDVHLITSPIQFVGTPISDRGIYVGMEVRLIGSNIPTNLNSKVVITCICRKLVEDIGYS